MVMILATYQVPHLKFWVKPFKHHLCCHCQEILNQSFKAIVSSINISISVPLPSIKEDFFRFQFFIGNFELMFNALILGLGFMLFADKAISTRGFFGIVGKRSVDLVFVAQTYYVL